MWDLIVSVPDHCLYFYFRREPSLSLRLDPPARNYKGQHSCKPNYGV